MPRSALMRTASRNVWGYAHQVRVVVQNENARAQARGKKRDMFTLELQHHPPLNPPRDMMTEIDEIEGGVGGVQGYRQRARHKMGAVRCAV